MENLLTDNPDCTRFWDKVNKTDTCWLWTGNTEKIGYGIFKLKGKALKAHRLSYAYHKNSIPAGNMVLHRCDVRNCVNPDHLFLGTQTDNMRDMTAKGRHWANGKTHCKRGHEYNETNTKVYNGCKSCKICMAEHNKRYFQASQAKKRETSEWADVTNVPYDVDQEGTVTILK